MYQFSDLDKKIVKTLKKDGRMSNQKIAASLGVATSLVTSRIRRMTKANAMKIVAVTDFSAFNYNILLPIGVDVKGRKTSEVAKNLATIPQVTSVQLCVGKHDIELLVMLETIDELQDLLLNHFSKIKGIRSLAPSIAVDVVKFEFDVAPI